MTRASRTPAVNVAICVVTGLLVPLLLFGVWEWLEGDLTRYRRYQGFLEPISWFLWPTAIMLAGTAGQEGIPYLPLLVSAALNAVLYGGIGWGFWNGLPSRKWISFVLLLFVVAWGVFVFVW